MSSNEGAQKSRGRMAFAWIVRSFFVLVVCGTLLTAGGIYGLFLYFSKDLPRILAISDYRPAIVTQIFMQGESGMQLVGEFFKDRRYVVPYEKIPEVIIRAFVASEDDRFFEHQGINPLSILRAAIVNIRAGEYVQGGSTITQQVTKSLLLTPEKKVVRKVKEMILANRLELALSKQQILFLYLNEIYLGHGAYGVQAACKVYFNKDVGEATLAEAALLAGLPQAPSKYSPLLNPKKAKERQLYVLRRMYENGYISQAQMGEAAGQSVRLYGENYQGSKSAPWVVEHARRYLLEKLGEKALYEGGLTVFLPGTIALARQAETSLKEGLSELDRRVGFRGPVKHLADTATIEKFLRQQRAALLDKALGFKMFMPDGRIDASEAMASAKLGSETALLKVGDVEQGVVTGYDERRKAFRLLIGAAKATMPLETAKWARPGAAPSRFLKKGDVVHARISQVADSEAEVSLDQIPEVQGAILSLDLATGDALSMVGGYSYGSSEFNRAIQAQRQPGSAFKPLIYAAALEKGFTPASVIVDSPLVFKSEDEAQKWKPKNFEEKFFGDTTFRQALIRSMNVPTIKILQAVEVGYQLDFVKRIGLEAQLPRDLTMALGSGSVSLLELTKAYAVFARQGRKIEPVFIQKVLDRDGRVLEERKSPKPWLAKLPEPGPSASPPPPDAVGAASIWPPLLTEARTDEPEQVVDPRVAYVLTTLMKEVVSFGTGYKAKSLGWISAGKTGTTSEAIDAWYVGFTPEVITGVWVGYDTLKTMGPHETGARAALPIWLSYMKAAILSHEQKDFRPPPGIVFASIDTKSGKLASASSASSIREAFIEGTQPTERAEAARASTPESDYFREDIQ